MTCNNNRLMNTKRHYSTGSRLPPLRPLERGPRSGATELACWQTRRVVWGDSTSKDVASFHIPRPGSGHAYHPRPPTHPVAVHWLWWSASSGRLTNSILFLTRRVGRLEYYYDTYLYTNERLKPICLAVGRNEVDDYRLLLQVNDDDS